MLLVLQQCKLSDELEIFHKIEIFNKIIFTKFIASLTVPLPLIKVGSLLIHFLEYIHFCLRNVLSQHLKRSSQQML